MPPPARVVAVAPREPVVPVLSRVVLLRLPVPAGLHPPREPAAPLRAQLPVLEGLVREPVVLVELLLSRQSCSAAMAGTTP